METKASCGNEGIVWKRRHRVETKALCAEEGAVHGGGWTKTSGFTVDENLFASFRIVTGRPFRRV